MRRFYFLFFLFLLFSCEQKTKKTYNVLFIAVDDLNDWTGFLGGHPQAKTPNLDRLASQSVIFEKAYCAVPVCNPSRVAIMTGMSAPTTGIYHNSQYMWESNVLKDNNAVTLPKYFAQQGYHTMAMGKLFHSQGQGKFSHAEEWEVFHFPKGDRMNKHPNYSDTLLVSGMDASQKRHRNFDWGELEDVSFENTSDYFIAQFAAEELAKQQDKPFFLAAGLFRPHLPWYLPKGYYDQFPLEDIILPAFMEEDMEDIPRIGKNISDGFKEHGDYQRLKRYGKFKETVQAYLAGIKYADDCLGIILDALEKSPYKDNTIVVLWGDHGWHHGEKLHYRKFALWEESNRVPLLIHMPGITKAGSRSKRTVSLLDLYPTLVDACNLPINSQLEGHSLMPLLKNPAEKWEHPAVSTMGFMRHTIRSEDFRYIVYEDGSEELYDHRNDPNEWTNLALDPEYKHIKEELKIHLPKINTPEVSKADTSWEVQEQK
ncbi:MAG: sulfatase [Bacteroidota bacterium]